MGQCLGLVTANRYIKEMKERIPSHERWSFQDKQLDEMIREYYHEQWLPRLLSRGGNETRFEGIKEKYLIKPGLWRRRKAVWPCCCFVDDVEHHYY